MVAIPVCYCTFCNIGDDATLLVTYAFNRYVCGPCLTSRIDHLQAQREEAAATTDEIASTLGWTWDIPLGTPADFAADADVAAQAVVADDAG